MDESQSAIVRSKTTILPSSVLLNRGSSAKKGIRTSSKRRGSFKGGDTSVKDPKVAAALQLLEKKKLAELADSEHKPTIVGVGAACAPSTADKIGLSKIKRSMIHAGSAAPIKLKIN